MNHVLKTRQLQKLVQGTINCFLPVGHLINTQFRMKHISFIFLTLTWIISFAQTDLRVSYNGHYLEKMNGTPFLWLGDTSWSLAHRLTRSEALAYLNDRQEKGFTIIQSVAHWYPHGAQKKRGPLNAVNAYGHRPFEGRGNDPDTAAPLVVEGGGPDNPNDYWDHLDFIVRETKRRGMYLALLPTWGSAFINRRFSKASVEYTSSEAKAYGHFLGNRYKNESHIIWVLGGDVDPQNSGVGDKRSVYRSMAEGIGRGATGDDGLQWNKPSDSWNQLMMTFHAVGTPKATHQEGGSSSIWFNNDPWLDINMIETYKWTYKVYSLVKEDYEKTKPIKPTILGEGAYEYGAYGKECGLITPLVVRQQAYHSFFGGGGHTYGHTVLWRFLPVCGITWQQALSAPGVKQITSIMKPLLIQQEWWKWVPDQSIITSKTGNGSDPVTAVKSNDDTRILVYYPRRHTVSIKNTLGFPAQGRWFDPRNGTTTYIGTFEKNHIYNMISPEGWEDAVLILEVKSTSDK